MLVKIWHVKLKSHAFLILFATFDQFRRNCNKKATLKQTNRGEKPEPKDFGSNQKRQSKKKHKKIKCFLVEQRNTKIQNLFLLYHFFSTWQGFFCLFFCNLQENTKNFVHCRRQRAKRNISLKT